ncbi:MAG: PH domain-containing protein [Lachnospiraceae bacterium]|jgi:hypothetical protein|nr:PH domain-containing protein [Lachnospiraceae bacterium]
MAKHKNIVWRDRKRNALGLPWSFTVYELGNDRLFINRGLFNTREDEVRLYRITDMTLTRSFWQKLFGMGTIHFSSADQAMGNFDIKNIKKVERVKEMFSEMVEKARREARVYTRETMHSGGMPMPGMMPMGSFPQMQEIDPEDYENHMPVDDDNDDH